MGLLSRLSTEGMTLHQDERATDFTNNVKNLKMGEMAGSAMEQK